MSHSTPDNLIESHTVLTANRRQAARLRNDHARAQRDAGRSLWPTPDILPWDAWLRRLWDELLVSGGDAHSRLLTAHQERLLWEQAIQDSPSSDGLLQPTATAQRAQEAWRLLHAYEQSLPRADEWPGPDVRAFVEWAGSYRRRCERQGWLDGARLPAYLAGRIRRGELTLPDTLTLRGFDELAPAQRSLLGAVEERGCVLEPWREERRESRAIRLACENAEEEIERAARWTRQLLEADRRGEPAGTIGIVVHDLNALRATVTRIFDDMLDPAAVLPAAPPQALYNISLGRPLHQHPVVAAALNVLQLGVEPGALEVERLGGLLRSPFLEGFHDEMGRRARLDALLRESGEPHVSVNTLLYYAAEGSGAAPLLRERLGAWRARRYELPFRQGAAGWAGALADLLRRAGWPRGRALESGEFQAVEAWREVMAEFATLDEVAGYLSYSQAVARLQRLAAETLFQPRTPELPVQILGLLEAEGLGFDHLWVIGWHDEVWPAPPRPHPLLPVVMQRRCGMPHGSAARELAFARGVTERLLSAAPQVVVSWPRREADRELRASPLIGALPEVEEGTLGLWRETSYARKLLDSATLEALADDTGLPCPEGELTRGGAAVFKEQAACPFRAYARFRLGGEPLGTPRPGLDAPARGSLLHRALENFWRSIPGHRVLARLTPEERQEQIAVAVRAAIAAEAKHRPATFTERFAAVEQARLERRLSDWLAVELQRAPFQVIGAERPRDVEVGRLRVQARIDRIDRLDDGRLVIVDYKSGQTTVQAWFGERPDEPQLPLYALSSDAPLAALAFAELRPGGCRFKGLAEEADLLPGVNRKAHGLDPEWEWGELLGEWSLVLAGLAAAFCAGDARVDPKKGYGTCRYCALTAFCRIAEAQLAEGTDDE